MGQVEKIFIADGGGEPMREIAEARAIPGSGLEGDRYATGDGEFSGKPGARQLTLIEGEALESAAKEYDMEFSPGETRRNVVTRGIALNHLVGEEFSLGDVRVRGIKLCEPCNYLEKITQAGIKQAFVHRGGLRVEILSEGTIRPGDPITI